MGNPHIYWYPDPSGSLEKLDLGEGLSDIQEFPSALVADAYAGDGTPYRSFLGATFRVRIVLERFGTVGTSSLERKFTSLQAHLNRGGYIGFSRDHAKTWSGYCAGGSYLERGWSTLYTYGNGYAAWNSSAALASGDEIAVESNNPEAYREINTVSSVSPSDDITLGSSLLYTYTETTIVRWRDFYPVLWLPEDQLGKPIVTHDHRRNFTLDMTLEFCLAAMFDLWDTTDRTNEYDGWNLGLTEKSGVETTIKGKIALRDETAPVGSAYGFSIDQKLGRKYTAGTGSKRMGPG